VKKITEFYGVITWQGPCAEPCGVGGSRHDLVLINDVTKEKLEISVYGYSPFRDQLYTLVMGKDVIIRVFQHGRVTKFITDKRMRQTSVGWLKKKRATLTASVLLTKPFVDEIDRVITEGKEVPARIRKVIKKEKVGQGIHDPRYDLIVTDKLTDEKVEISIYGHNGAFRRGISQLNWNTDIVLKFYQKMKWRKKYEQKAWTHPRVAPNL